MPCVSKFRFLAIKLFIFNCKHICDSLIHWFMHILSNDTTNMCLTCAETTLISGTLGSTEKKTEEMHAHSLYVSFQSFSVTPVDLKYKLCQNQPNILSNITQFVPKYCQVGQVLVRTQSRKNFFCPVRTIFGTGSKEKVKNTSL